MMRRPLAIGLSLLLAGCASVPAQRVDDAAAFVTRVAEAHHRPAPTFVVGRNVDPPAWFSHRGQTLAIRTDVFAGNLWELTVAHELGHFLLRHDPTTVAIGDIRAMETAANEMAIRLLVMYRDYSIETALQRFHGLAIAALARPVAYGHAPPCDEIKDLLARFPQHRALWQTWECAPAPD